MTKGGREDRGHNKGEGHQDMSEGGGGGEITR
jgi:hypothetical protein